VARAVTCFRADRCGLVGRELAAPRVDDRRVLNGIFWVLRSGAPWHDMPERFWTVTTCYKRIVRWRRSGVWSQIKGGGALAATHDAAVPMIDTPTVECISAPPLSLKTGTSRSGDHEAD
jgi:Putative transposase of IS4/5 family (DUF4096)